MKCIPRVGRGIPLSVINGSAARVASRVLRYLAHDSTLTIEKLDFGIAFKTISRILMRANKIEWYFVTFAVVHELFNPLAPRCGGTTDLKRGIYLLDGFGRRT